MDTAHISVPAVTRAGTRATVSAAITLAGRTDELWYTFHDAQPVPVADAFVAAVLLPAMFHGVPIVSEEPVSLRLLHQLDTIQDIYATWVPALRRVSIQAPAAAVSRAHGRGVGSFYTGGIDSSYTLLRHLPRLTSLIYVHGFASPIVGPGRTRATERLRHVASVFVKQPVEVETNFVPLLDQWLELERRGHVTPLMYNFELAHGAALASVALLLQSALEQVYVPASHTYDHLFPWGSHPLLDPLWSTESLEVVHDGADAARVEKARVVGQSTAALESLWVCTEMPDGAANCGRCEKCLRTMVNLRIAGARHRGGEAFAEPLDLLRVALLRAPAYKPFLRENLDAARAAGGDPALVAALTRALNPWSPGRIALQTLLAGWKLVKRVVPVERRAGHIRWAQPNGRGQAPSEIDPLQPIVKRGATP